MVSEKFMKLDTLVTHIIIEVQLELSLTIPWPPMNSQFSLALTQGFFHLRWGTKRHFGPNKGLNRVVIISLDPTCLKTLQL